jgi:hypothetical protein
VFFVFWEEREPLEDGLEVISGRGGVIELADSITAVGVADTSRTFNIEHAGFLVPRVVI